MEKIYDILSKHFIGEASAEEEQQITEFRNIHPIEYKTFERMWKKGEIKTHHFNTDAAWQNVKDGLRKNNSKPDGFGWLKIAATIAIIALSVTAAFLVYDNILTNDSVVAQTGIDEKSDCIRLADGSQIWLNKGSKLIYPETFSGRYRKVVLKGEAFFDISRDEKHPFIITTEFSDIKVLGTSFNVSAGTGETEVNVTSGLVEVQSLANKKKVQVSPNETAIASSKTVVKMETLNLNYNAWRTGFFQFENASLEKVIEDLSAFYTESIQIASEQILKCKLTATFDNLSLSEVIQIIEITCGVEIKEIDGNYVINSNQ